MRTNNAIKNIIVSLGMYLALTVTSLFLRRLVLQQFDMELVAYDGLLSNVFSLIGIASLGAENLFNYRIYQAYAKGEQKQINRVVSLYSAFYRLLACLVLGVCVVVFFLLPVIFSGKVQFWIPFYMMYGLYALSALSSYLFAYWNVLLVAGQKEYVVTTVQSSLQIAGQFVKVGILLATQNFLLYVACNNLITVFSHLLVMICAKKINPDIKLQPVHWNDFREEGLLREIRDVFFIKVTSTIMYNIDNLLITFLVSTKMVTYFSNYTLIAAYVMQAICKLIWPLRGVIADLVYKEEQDSVYRIYRTMDLGWFFASSLLFVCYAVVFQPAIAVLFGKQFLLPYSFVLMFSLQYYVNMKYQVVGQFRGALGDYSVDRKYTIIGAIVNLFLSIVLGKLWGLSGIVLGTVVALLSFWHSYLLLVNKNKFGQSLLRSWLRESGFFLLACGELAIAWFFTRKIPYTFTGMILCGIIGITVPTTINLIVFYRTPEFQDILGRSKRIFQRKKLP